MAESRTKKTFRNVTVLVLFQLIGILINFIARAFFVKYLGEVYLGLNGLFSNILSVLSLAELGFGAAIAFSLYKPLAENDVEKVKSIMRLYKKIYTIVGCVVFALGLVLLPFLKFFVGNDYGTIPNLYFIFILYVLNSAVTYFYSYKRAILNADQNKYLDTINRYIFLLLLNIAQILVLVFTGNFIAFLFCQTVSNVLENVAITFVINKKYPYLKEKSEPVDFETKKQIKDNTVALVFHKIGGILVGSIDSILISVFVGLAIVGRYSNYLLISSGVSSIISQIFTAFTASVGNFGATESLERRSELFHRINYLNFIIANFCIVALYFLYNNFIRLWIGDYLLTNTEVFLIVINFLFFCLRRPVLMFKDALGIYRPDRFKPLVESVVNLTVSIVLGYFWGLSGILLGTIITYMTVSCWVETRVLFKYGLKTSPKKYLLNLLKYFLILAASFSAVYAICLFIPENTFISFLLRFVVCLVVPSALALLCCIGDKEQKYFFGLIGGFFKSLKAKLFKGRVALKANEPHEESGHGSVQLTDYNASSENDVNSMAVDNIGEFKNSVAQDAEVNLLESDKIESDANENAREQEDGEMTQDDGKDG